MGVNGPVPNPGPAPRRYKTPGTEPRARYLGPATPICGSKCVPVYRFIGTIVTQFCLKIVTIFGWHRYAVYFCLRNADLNRAVATSSKTIVIHSSV